jgi:hypothetical protein
MMVMMMMTNTTILDRKCSDYIFSDLGPFDIMPLKLSQTMDSSLPFYQWFVEMHLRIGSRNILAVAAYLLCIKIQMNLPLGMYFLRN